MAERFDLRDLAVERVDQRNGHTMEFSSSPKAHRIEYDDEVERLIDGRIYLTPSKRRWRAHVTPGARFVTMIPLGYDTVGFGGVKARRVELHRLEGFDRTWRPDCGWSKPRRFGDNHQLKEQ
jgi:hypothetical protein